MEHCGLRPVIGHAAQLNPQLSTSKSFIAPLYHRFDQPRSASKAEQVQAPLSLH